MDNFFEENLLDGSPEKLNELKHWLFEENIRLAIKEKELENAQNKFIKEREEYQTEMKEINLKIVSERQRLKDEENFFDKKMEILRNGFADLDADRRRFEREKIAFEGEMRASREKMNSVAFENLAGSLFAGVTNQLALKKRYRDLIKIFHPDNLCGDTEMVTKITKEYERIKSEFEYPFKNANY